MTMNQGSLIEQYKEDMGLYLEHRGAALSLEARRGMLAALCSDRGALNFSGTQGLVGEEEEQVLSLVSLQELQMVLQGVDVEKIKSRLMDFLRLSEENGGDVSLIEPEEEQEAIEEEGKILLWGRHDIDCQLEGMGFWLERREDLKAAIEPGLMECRQRLSQLDALWKEGIRHFLPFNAYRRSHRDAYPQPQKFWWWHLLSDCDLAGVYRMADLTAGSRQQTAGRKKHLQDCPYCPSLLQEIERTKSLLGKAKEMPPSHPRPEDLVRLYYGEMGGPEEEALEWHLKLCETCRWEFEAIQRGLEEDELAEELALLEKLGSIPIVQTYSLPPEAELVEVASAGGEDIVQRLPGEKIYQDDEIEAWVNHEGGRVVLHVYGKDLQGLGSLEAVDCDSLEPQTVTLVTRRPTEAEFDLGSIRELKGKKVLLSLRYNEREIRLPRLDLTEEEGQ